FNFGTNIHITNENKPERQPQNRFLATLDASDILKLQFGDAYPTLPSLVMSGKRVRGITGSLNLGFFNIDVSVGQTERLIEGTILRDSTFRVADTSSRPKESLFLHDSTYRMFRSGVYDRDLIAIRPSFGSGENFQWGITYMKVKDNPSSIVYGTFPKENLVAGTDFMFAFDDQHFKWQTQVALTISNNDISKGNFSDDDFRGFGKGKSDSAKVVDDLISTAKLARNVITVNDEIFPANPADGSLPSLGIETELTMNYLNNFIRALGFRRGKAFQSFGNEFVQTDVQGFNVSDRIRMLANRVLLSASYELKNNNIAGAATAITTTYGTLNTSATVYPANYLPSLTLGYGLISRKNPITLADTSDAVKRQQIADEGTGRYYVGMNYDFTVSRVRQSVTTSVSIANKADNTFYKRNQDNVNVSAAVTSRFRIPLQTTVGFVYSSNTGSQNVLRKTTNVYDSTTTTSFAYQTIALGAQYRMLNDKLTLIANFAPSFGDFQRTLLQAGADYRLNDYHTLTSQIDFIKNPNTSDLIASVVWRFNF
ncbi:MAG: hypothetical protein HY966_05160, partial [Ignavibacteriales bacterium]|nr:hypothetical protein [Ignavibacteriales bacterium]